MVTCPSQRNSGATRGAIPLPHLTMDGMVGPRPRLKHDQFWQLAGHSRGIVGKSATIVLTGIEVPYAQVVAAVQRHA